MNDDYHGRHRAERAPAGRRRQRSAGGFSRTRWRIQAATTFATIAAALVGLAAPLFTNTASARVAKAATSISPASAPATSPKPSPSPTADPRTVRVPRNFAKGSVSIPKLGVVAPLVTVRVKNNEMGVPSDLSQVGLYDAGGKLDGPDGTVLLVGHINWAGSPGVLGRIGELATGDVVITRGDGNPQAWRVFRTNMYLKSSGLPQAIFEPHGPRQSVLVTCGGEFDAANDNYLSNIVVRARPVPTVLI